jgi:hypothetical protein
VIGSPLRARELRTLSLFAAALVLLFGGLGSVLAHRAFSAAGFLVGAVAIALLVVLFRIVYEPVSPIRFTGERITVGHRTLTLSGPLSCSFADRSGISSWSAENSGAPAVELRTPAGRVRFRPNRYERTQLARLVHHLVTLAQDGDARGWLVAQWPPQAAEGTPEPAVHWINPIVAIGIAVLFLMGLALAVFTFTHLGGR